MGKVQEISPRPESNPSGLGEANYKVGDLVSWVGECYLLSGRIPGKMGASELSQITFKRTHTGLVTNAIGDHIEVMHGKKFYVLQLMLSPDKLSVWKEEMW